METASHFATVVAAVVATIAIAFGYYQFHQTQLLQRNMYADQLYLKFAEQLSSSSAQNGLSAGDPGFWKQSALLATTESVYRLTKSDPYWVATVTAMLKAQSAFLESTSIKVETFNADFIAHAKSVIPALKSIT